MPDFHKEWYSLANTYNRIALAAPRGHAKSTCFSLVYPLWCLLTKRKRFILMVSDTASQATSLLGSIIEELETNDRIIADFGKIAGYVPDRAEDKMKWTAKDIVTTTGIKVMAAGWKAKLRGLKHGAYRPDLILLDDVENDESVDSDVQRAKVKNVFYKSILNLGDENTQIIEVGTILHTDALLTTLIEVPPSGWVSRIYRAVKENGQPLWPSYWSTERLEQKKAEIGSIVFEQEYMNNPIDAETQIIKPVAFYEQLDLSSCDFYAYVDLAISEKETADYTAIVTIAKLRSTNKLYVIEPTRIRGGILQQLDLLFSLYAKYKYKKIGSESVAYQKAFYQLALDESRRRNIFLPIVEVTVDKDKIRRTLEVTPLIENGTILFNNGHQDFMAELLHFPRSKHDDFVDSFVGGVKLATQSSTSNAVSTGGGIIYPKRH